MLDSLAIEIAPLDVRQRHAKNGLGISICAAQDSRACGIRLLNEAFLLTLNREDLGEDLGHSARALLISQRCVIRTMDFYLRVECGE
ncbi:hypothetical protein JKG68_31695 [Microvirga aerilata]|uniref:Uncharacterized protein n=1 Tax=Microvirga aerilata TaxID=670292 RepID=A0A936ZJM5_9HYPH|nr:hypothetical protein [Microvirga aerilata]MBL0408432.1 hypothetical protein [Microvirga aerilata]